MARRRVGSWYAWKPERVYLFRTDGPGGADFIDYGPTPTGGTLSISRPENCACCGNRSARYLRKVADGYECNACLGYMRQ